MPRKRNKNNSDPKSILTILEDLTVNDVANNDRKRNCSKKAVNKVQYKGGAAEQLAWYNLQVTDDEDDTEQELLNTTFPPVTGKKRKRRRKLDLIVDNSGTIDLHIDIWDLISGHLRPEDVGRFAAICRKTAYIVGTAKFWRTLYDRYTVFSITLPNGISYWDIHSRHVIGLRNRVIRALYISYEPLARTRRCITGNGDLAAVTERIMHSRCMSFWYRKRNRKFHYVFKFFNRDGLPNQALNGRFLCESDADSQVRLDKFQSIVCRDAEDSCYLLEVACSVYCPIPQPIVGQYLNLVCECPAEITNSRMSKLSLVFSGAAYGNTISRQYAANSRNNIYRPAGWNDVNKVVLQPVEGVRVLPWWDQQYYTLASPQDVPVDDHGEKQNPVWYKI